MEVSVVIPTYNRASQVMRAIESVLAQTYKDYEIIVVDDGSTDQTRKLLDPYSGCIRYVYQANAGPAAARNTGITRAEGEWLAFLDSDDIWLPHKLETQLSHCINLKADLCFHDLSVFDENITSWNEFVCKKDRGLLPAKTGVLLDAYQRMMTTGHLFLTPAFFVKRSVISDAGYFNETFKTSEDLDLYFRLAARHRVAYISEVLATFTRGANRVIDTEIIYMDRINAIRRSLEDRLNCQDLTLARWARKGLLQETRNLAGFYRRTGSYYSALGTYVKYFLMRRTSLAKLVDHTSSNAVAVQVD